MSSVLIRNYLVVVISATVVSAILLVTAALVIDRVKARLDPQKKERV